MKKNMIEKIEKEIVEKTKLPNEVKEKIKKETFTNFIVGSVIILYFIFIVLGSVGSTKNIRAIDLNIFSFLFLAVSIFLFEIAYRKDDGKLAIYGLESLAVAIFTLFLPYIIFELNADNKKYYLMASIYIAVYYILKSIIISVKIKNKYKNSNISDIKEIVKKEKTKRRIKEDIEEIELKDKNNKNNKKNVGDDAHIDPQQKQTSKRGKSKNIQTTNKENKNNVGVAPKGDPKKELQKSVNQEQETTPKKRGRPKKSETTNIENKNNVGVALKGNPQPKKRGRPRKVAINND